MDRDARKQFLSSKNVFHAKHSFYVILPFSASSFLSIFSHERDSLSHMCLISPGGCEVCVSSLAWPAVLTFWWKLQVSVALQWHRPSAGIPTFWDLLELVLWGPCSRVSVGFSLVTLWDRQLVGCTCVEAVNDGSHLWFSSRSSINCRSLILLSDLL